MKKIMLSLVAMCMMIGAKAQDTQNVQDAQVVQPIQEQMLVYENPKIPVYIGEITYQPLTKGQKTTGVLTGLLNGEISVEDETMVEGAKAALAGCLRDVNRFIVKEGEVSQEDKEKGCLVLTGKITFCNFTEKLNNSVMDKEGLIIAYVTLTDPKDNRVCFNLQVSGASWLSVYNSIAQCRDHAQNNLWVDTANKLRKAYPLRGHMLEKGFMKGKKQKLQEFYIDLGTDHRTFKDSNVDVYIVKRIAGRIARKWIGYARVIDVEGDDISLCKIKKNGDLIKDAFDRGEEIAVNVY